MAKRQLRIAGTERKTIADEGNELTVTFDVKEKAKVSKAKDDAEIDD